MRGIFFPVCHQFSMLGNGVLHDSEYLYVVIITIMKMINAHAKALHCPIEYILNSLFASTSALIGNARRIQATDTWQVPPHLWFVNVGSPSAGKSQATDLYTKILKRVENEHFEEYQQSHNLYLEQLDIKEIKEDKWKKACKKAIANDQNPQVKPKIAKKSNHLYAKDYLQLTQPQRS